MAQPIIYTNQDTAEITLMDRDNQLQLDVTSDRRIIYRNFLATAEFAQSYSIVELNPDTNIDIVNNIVESSITLTDTTDTSTIYDMTGIITLKQNGTITRCKNEVKDAIITINQQGSLLLNNANLICKGVQITPSGSPVKIKNMPEALVITDPCGAEFRLNNDGTFTAHNIRITDNNPNATATIYTDCSVTVRDKPISSITVYRNSTISASVGTTSFIINDSNPKVTTVINSDQSIYIGDENLVHVTVPIAGLVSVIDGLSNYTIANVQGATFKISDKMVNVSYGSGTPFIIDNTGHVKINSVSVTDANSGAKITSSASNVIVSDEQGSVDVGPNTIIANGFTLTDTNANQATIQTVGNVIITDSTGISVNVPKTGIDIIASKAGSSLTTAGITAYTIADGVISGTAMPFTFNLNTGSMSMPFRSVATLNANYKMTASDTAATLTDSTGQIVQMTSSGLEIKNTNLPYDYIITATSPLSATIDSLGNANVVYNANTMMSINSTGQINWNVQGSTQNIILGFGTNNIINIAAGATTSFAIGTTAAPILTIPQPGSAIMVQYGRFSNRVTDDNNNLQIILDNPKTSISDANGSNMTFVSNGGAILTNSMITTTVTISTASSDPILDVLVRGNNVTIAKSSYSLTIDGTSKLVTDNSATFTVSSFTTPLSISANFPSQIYTMKQSAVSTALIQMKTREYSLLRQTTTPPTPGLTQISINDNVFKAGKVLFDLTDNSINFNSTKFPSLNLKASLSGTDHVGYSKPLSSQPPSSQCVADFKIANSFTSETISLIAGTQSSKCPGISPIGPDIKFMGARPDSSSNGILFLQTDFTCPGTMYLKYTRNVIDPIPPVGETPDCKFIIFT